MCSSDLFPGLTILSVDVSEEDKGIVIGRKGRTINAIRDLITINAIRNNRRVKVLIKDDERKDGDSREEKQRDEDSENIFDDEI